MSHELVSATHKFAITAAASSSSNSSLSKLSSSAAVIVVMSRGTDGRPEQGAAKRMRVELDDDTPNATARSWMHPDAPAPAAAASSLAFSGSAPARPAPPPQAAAVADSSTPALPEGVCPMMLQPVTTLALVCRFLDSRALLAATQTSRWLSAAATHPLTFQHGVSIRVEGMRGVAVSGPAARFSSVSTLQRALPSKLLNNFRIFALTAPGDRIRIAKPKECTLINLVRVMRGQRVELDANGNTITSSSSNNNGGSGGLQVHALTLHADYPYESEWKKANLSIAAGPTVSASSSSASSSSSVDLFAPRFLFGDGSMAAAPAPAAAAAAAAAATGSPSRVKRKSKRLRKLRKKKGMLETDDEEEDDEVETDDEEEDDEEEEGAHEPAAAAAVAASPLQRSKRPRRAGPTDVGAAAAAAAVPVTPPPRDLFDLCSLPCTRFLKMLSLHTPAFMTEDLLYALPPSLELLQLQQISPIAETGCILPANLATLLSARGAPLARLRQLLVLEPGRLDCANPEMLRRPPPPLQLEQGTRLADLAILAETIQALPHIENVGWSVLVPIARIIEEIKQPAAAKKKQPPLPVEAPAVADAEALAAPAAAAASLVPMEVADLVAELPALPKIRSLSCTSYAPFGQTASGSLDSGGAVLSLFPDLRHLAFLSYERFKFKAAQVPGGMSSWPVGVSSTLIELCITGRGDELDKTVSGPDAEQGLVDSLALGGRGRQWHALQRLVLVGNQQRFRAQLQPHIVKHAIKLDSMLSAMPALTSLAIPNLHLPNLLAFRFAAKLTSLRGLAWPYEDSSAEPVVALHRPGANSETSLDRCFPSLLSLYVAHAAEESRFQARHLLQAIPSLTSVGWKGEVSCHPARIEQAFDFAQKQAAAREARAKERAEREAFNAARAHHLANLLSGGVSLEKAQANWDAAQKIIRMIRDCTSAEENRIRSQHAAVALAIAKDEVKQREAADSDLQEARRQEQDIAEARERAALRHKGPFASISSHMIATCTRTHFVLELGLGPRFTVGVKRGRDTHDELLREGVKNRETAQAIARVAQRKAATEKARMGGTAAAIAATAAAIAATAKAAEAAEAASASTAPATSAPAATAAAASTAAAATALPTTCDKCGTALRAGRCMRGRNCGAGMDEE